MKLKNRAFSVLNVKNIDDEKREITGIASTPATDRHGDIVDPLGMSFEAEIPLLLHHMHSMPVGKAYLGKATKDGVPFRAVLPVIEEEGDLKKRVDEAWHSVKYELIRAVSVGFNSSDYDVMSTGGIHFKKTSVYELSLVTIPANSQATIATIKSFDDEHYSRRDDVKTEKGSKANMTLKEKLAAAKALLASKGAFLKSLVEKGDEADVMSADDKSKFETATAEVVEIKDTIKRLESVIALDVDEAAPVNVEKGLDGKPAGARISATPGFSVTPTEKLEKGIQFARFVKCLGAAKGNMMHAQALAQAHYGNDRQIVDAMKAAVTAGSTTDPTWAAPLVDSYQRFAGDFIEFLRPQTIIGKFGSGNIPSLRNVPFNIEVAGQTSGGSAGWVGEGKAKPVTKFDFNTVKLGWAKIAAISVITEELMRFSNPAADAIVRDQLAETVIARQDADFIDPAKAEVLNVSPASITNGVTPITSAGPTADDIREDVAAIMTAYITANVSPAGGVWIMNELQALRLSLMQKPLGDSREFPGITMKGGDFLGFPAITSQYVPAGTVIFANASDIFLADDGFINVDASREASLEMETAPTHNSTTPTGVAQVSMWQTNSIAFRAERYINWKKRRASAVQVLTGVTWGVPAAP